MVTAHRTTDLNSGDAASQTSAQLISWKELLRLLFEAPV
jgi:hypothetical protein